MEFSRSKRKNLNNLGQLFIECGEWDNADRYFQMTLTIRHNLNDLLCINDTLTALGETYRRRGLWKEAIEIQKEMLEIARRLADLEK